MKLQLQIHRSLRTENDPKLILKEFQAPLRLIEAIIDTLHYFPDILDLVIEEMNPKAGILYIHEKRELNSLGMLESEMTEDLLIKIVPILHGG